MFRPKLAGAVQARYKVVWRYKNRGTARVSRWRYPVLTRFPVEFDPAPHQMARRSGSTPPLLPPIPFHD